MFRNLKNRVNQIKGNNNGGGGSNQNTPNTSLHHSQPPLHQHYDSTNNANNNRRRANSSSSSLAEQQRHLDTTVLPQALENKHLSKFDACVEACDALAASSSNQTLAMPRRRDPKTGLLDCSVLVSPDGDLLLLPQDQQQKDNHNNNGNNNNFEGSCSSMASEELGEEYESAIYVGHDLSTKGDKEWNGFSAGGWSIPATNLALRQTEQSLHDFADFCEEIVLSKKEQAARSKDASDKLRAASFERGPLYPSDLRQDAELMQGYGSFELTPTRVGPILFNGGTLHAAHVALEEFYTDIAEKETNRWRLASLKPKPGTLPPLRGAATQAEERSAQRQKALRNMYGRVKTMEDHLAQCKKEAQQRWKEVEQGEFKVNQMAQQRLVEQHRKREQQQLDNFHHQAGEQPPPSAAGAANAAEVWNMVSQLTETMENGMFEPMDIMPTTLQHPPAVGGVGVGAPAEPFLAGANASVAAPPPPPKPEVPMAAQVDVDDIEDEVGMHELRAAAFAADRAVQDASGSLLNVLSSLDQLKRSARVAAETNLLSACNSQANCIRSMISLERLAAEERLRHVAELEKIADKIDVRNDLNTYIRDDRKRKGGSSLLGEDDDGGVASALAVLTSHLEGDMGDDTHNVPGGSSYLSDDENTEGVAQHVTMEAVEEAIETMFVKNDQLRSDATESPERQKALEMFDTAVQLLCDVAQEKSRAARPRRSRMCYALNAKRSSDAELKTKKQFDSLCKVFVAILDGCDCETGGVSNAKMCMMLSQTFYFLQESSGESGEETGRSKRIYVQRSLLDHPLFQHEEFWDQVLYQCLSESLTNSGVMSNFERRKSKDATDHSSEWADSHKTKWFDLSPIERTEAASQVHAVVTAQLGALAHSMIEFNCGLERSCAFVRRMAIRNQLPLTQRTILLQHLIDRKSDRDASPNEFGMSFVNDENEETSVNPVEDEKESPVQAEPEPKGEPTPESATDQQDKAAAGEAERESASPEKAAEPASEQEMSTQDPKYEL